MDKYGEIYCRLCEELAIVKFKKKSGEERLMLSTRNVEIICLEYPHGSILLNGHDKRCHLKNGNIGVIDMVIGEGRSFNIDRLIDVQWLGIPKTREEYDKLYEKFAEIRGELKINTEEKVLSLEDLD